MAAGAAPAESRSYDLVLANYPEWQGEPARSLVICTQQRAGSTLLGEAIYFAGGLGCPVEYFHIGFRPGFERRWKLTGLRDYVATLHRLRTDPSGTFAVKLFWRDLLSVAREMELEGFGPVCELGSLQEVQRLSPEMHRQMFEAVFSSFIPRPVFVLLTRRDTVRQAVSLTIASQTRAWRKFGHDDGRGELRAEYSFDQIVRNLAGIQRWNADWVEFFRLNGLQYYEIVYEDLWQDYEATLRTFFAAVGRPDAPVVPPRLHKQADAQSEDFVRRFLADFRHRTGQPALTP